MKKTILSILLAVILTGTGAAYASSSALPGDTLYPVKTALEETRLLLADDEAEIGLLLQFSETRLAEIEQLTQQRRFDDLPLAAQGFETRMDELARAMAETTPQSPERAAAHAALVEAATAKHLQVLDRVLEQVPDEAKAAIQHASEASSKVHQMAQGRPEEKPGQGPPDEKPGGPPEDKPGGGPPEDKPGQGPPEDKPGQGPPEDKPGGGQPEG